MGWKAIAGAAPRARRFFAHTVWEAQLDRLSPARAVGYRVARIAHSAWRGFREHRLTSRAAALTYYTVLSLVPFLAFAFAVLKGFGAYGRFIQHTVRPYLQDTFGANPPLLRALEQVLQFVENTDVARLGTAGVLVLAYSAISLLANVESALNAIWGARSRRPWLRQVTDYTTLIVTTPLLMLVATTFATAAQSSGVITYLRGVWALGALIDALLGLTSLVVTIVALVVLYAILPNVKIRPASALLGGVVSGLLWQAALIVHVSSQAGVARYNALYSGFVALPIFLVWIYLSWAIVLVGGLIAASHQNERAARQRFRAEFADPALKQILALAIAARVTRSFMEHEPRASASGLAEQFQISPVVVEDVLQSLTGAGFLVTVVSGGEITYAPARDLSQLRGGEVLAALSRRPEAEPLRRAVAAQLPGRLVALAEGNARPPQRPDDPSIAELAALMPGPPDAGDPGKDVVDARSGEGADVMDAKQPDLPG